MASKLPKDAMTFKRFILRKDVLKLYRDILRAIRKVPNELDRKDLKQWARDDFKKYKKIDDEEAIRMMLTKGRMTLDELKTSLSLAS